jgi:hypothetical protein
MNDIVSQPINQLPSNPQEMTEYYRKMAEAYAAQEARGGSTISVKNGIMSLADQPIPGNQFAAVILDSVRLNTFYTQAYNPASIDPPVCYAIGRNDADLSPHPDMAQDLNYFKPQADRCSGCPHNEFGSGRTGTGKACTNRRRLVMLLAGTYNLTNQGLQMTPFMDAAHYETTPFLQMQLPPTSIKGWGEYVRASSAQYQRPFFGLVTRVYLYAHPTHGKEAIGFETLGPTPAEWDPTLMGRHNGAIAEIGQGYAPPQQRHAGGGFYQQAQG